MRFFVCLFFAMYNMQTAGDGRLESKTREKIWFYSILMIVVFSGFLFSVE